MQYGLTKNLNVYSPELGTGEIVPVMAGSYIMALKWVQNNVEDESEHNFFHSIAWAWYGLKKAGLLDKYELPKKLTYDSAIEVADKITIYLDDVEPDSLPLAKA
jgi:hypothetical protein